MIRLQAQSPSRRVVGGYAEFTPFPKLEISSSLEFKLVAKGGAVFVFFNAYDIFPWDIISSTARQNSSLYLLLFHRMQHQLVRMTWRHA